MNKEGLILIVDDELPIRRLLAIALGANGYKTVEAAAAKEVMVTATGHHPDLVIFDLGLPDEDGMEVLRRLREWYSKPILILSVRDLEDDIIQALDFGANDYLVKPFRTGELLARIRAAIRQKQSREDNPVIGIAVLVIAVANHTMKKERRVVETHFY